MSEIIATKPRTKGAKKAPPTFLTLADVFRGISDVWRLVDTAYVAAERGETIDTLLGHTLDLIGEARVPISKPTPNRIDAQSAYDLLFAPIACLDAAATISAGSVLHAAVVEAHATLDKVRTALDDAGPLVGSLPDLDRSREGNWVRGRDLAVAMVREGESHWDTDHCEPQRHTREGKACCIFATQYLQALIEDPTLLDGFATVLSAKLGVGDALTWDAFNLPAREYEAGVPGEDGTENGECEIGDDAAAPESSDQVPRAGANEPFDPYLLMAQASGVAYHAAVEAGITEDVEIIHGLADLVEAQTERVRLAVETEPADQRLVALEHASARLGSAIALVLSVFQDKDIVLFEAAASLLVMAKEVIDSKIDDMFAAEGAK